MARPRVFISSTFYDLKHIRSSLERFIESLGFDAVLSEKGDIAFSHEIPLDESCYREIANADIFVLVVGGRYGSAISSQGRITGGDFFDRYTSITQKEYETASKRDIPIFILVEKSVYGEYETYQKNRGNSEIKYAHVDSVNVFSMIEFILSQPRNNPVLQFDRYAEMEEWLREQWAGSFKELLRRITSQVQLATLSQRIQELAEVTETLKRYMEVVVSKVDAEKGKELVEDETKRLEATQVRHAFEKVSLIRHLVTNHKVELDKVLEAFKSATSLQEITGSLLSLTNCIRFRRTLRATDRNFKELNMAREVLGLPNFEFSADYGSKPVRRGK